MNIDEQGRVRFQRDSVRFTVTKSGVRAYFCEGRNEYAMNRDRTARAVYRNIDDVVRAKAILQDW